MVSVLKKALDLVIGTEPILVDAHHAQPKPNFIQKINSRKKLTERELIQKESEIGAKIFGEVPQGCRREFFNLDPATWIWYEEITDPNTRQKTSTTVRYEVHPNGVLKVQEGARYCFLEGAELDNFLAATRMYKQQISVQLYSGQLA